MLCTKRLFVCLVLPVSVDECLKLWKRLRDRYTRELKAIEATKRSGSGYVSRRAWEFTESMAFYKHCGRPRKTTCSLEPATYGDDGETAESIFATMENTPPAPSGVESPMDSPQELPMPATPPPLAERPPETGKQEAAPKLKKGKKNDNFEEQLLCRLDGKMSENEAFGISIGLSLDNMPRKVALKCKARIMTLLAEMEEENDVHTINIS
ncbi:uncharacterized protein LOC125758367 [Rhipicephalus sanguineus]|uniref:uncharacterized protein LOC125758367 n=1 Tax=Rhipicephalus sanguineus TaxID=34632 RepID=UPI0020C3A68B|nr:uncharacterized protein LOC125758367 [Rhipicephalus sanguineus]